MSADERQGVRFGLLVIAVMSVALAIVGWSLWPLGGLIVPVLGLIALRPRMHKRPRRTEGA